MVKELISVCGICVCASLLCKMVEKHVKEQAVMLGIGVCVFTMLFMLSDIPVIFGKIDKLASEAQIDSDYVTIIFKALGVCYLTQFSADICRDSGEGAIASVAEIFGKIQLVILSMPLFEDLIDSITVIME